MCSDKPVVPALGRQKKENLVLRRPGLRSEFQAILEVGTNTISRPGFKNKQSWGDGLVTKILFSVLSFEPCGDLKKNGPQRLIYLNAKHRVVALLEND